MDEAETGGDGPGRAAMLAALARPLQHDVNNLLTVVYANLEMLRRNAAEGAPRRQLDRVEEATRRIDGTSRALLSLLRRPPGEGPAPVRLAEAMEALLPLLQMLLPRAGGLSLESAPEGWTVAVDRARLDEALLGLVFDLGRAAGSQASPPRLAVAVANRPAGRDGGADAVELSLRSQGAPVPDGARAALRRLAEAAGGALAETEGGAALRLSLPRVEDDPD
jgi:hypothetical protein